MHNFRIDVTIQHLGVSSMLESFKSNSIHNRLFFPGNFDQMQNVYLYGNMSRFSCHFEIVFREDSYVYDFKYYLAF